MDTIANLKLKSQLLRDLEATIQRYEAEFHTPIPLAILGRKFGKRARAFGGLTPMVHEMEENGLIRIIMTATGGYDLSAYSEPDLKAAK